MNTIDLIIPAYNAEETLFKALSSVAIQTISKEVNVCIVDDCSDYPYDDIIKRFDGILNIQCLRMDKNIGPGNCRQFGIDNTKAPYIMFLDADDQFFNAFAMITLLEPMRRGNFDLVIGDFFECILNSPEIVVHRRDGTWMFSKIYRRSFLHQKGVRFNPDCSYANEDSGFNSIATILMGNNKKGYVDRPIYLWNSREESITRRNNREYGYTNGFEGFLKNQEYALDYVMNRKDCNQGELDRQIIANIILCFQTSCECLISSDHNHHVGDILNKTKEFYDKYKEKILPLIKSPLFFEHYKGIISNLPILPVSFYDFMALIDNEIDKNELLEEHCGLLAPR